MAEIALVLDYRAVRYTGSNSAEIIGKLASVTLISESGGVLVLETPTGNGQWTINTLDYVIYTQGALQNVMNQSTLDFFFTRNAVYADLTSMQSAITTLQTQVSGLMATADLKSAGIKELPLLSPGASNQDVDLTVAVSGMTGTIKAQVFASATILGSITLGTPTWLTTTQVRVPVTNTGVLGLSGARLFVTIN